jgi:hypothetical protein
VSATQTTPTPAPVPELPPATPVARCLDCGAPLAGKFCSECGQRAQLRSLSIPSLMHDAIHDLAHLDSRVWQTLRLLLLRPGYLTNEFLAGRRTRFLPPFRLYLVLSIVFFLMLSCNPAEETIILDDARSGGDRSAVATGERPDAFSQALDELQREIPGQAAPGAAGQPSGSGAAAKAAAAVGKIDADPDSSVLGNADCSRFEWGPLGSAWMRPHVLRVCENLQAVSKREFGRALFGNVPKMMFFFLPLLALVNSLLYAFRRRKYVEHLLFYTHYHAFAFLLLILQMSLHFVLGISSRLAFVASLVTLATAVYLFVALYKAMRVVYGQSRALTIAKYIVVLITYGVSLLLTFFGTFLYTALTV